MKKILVTGAAGFIGASLVKKLLMENYEVIGIDNINNYYDQRLKQDRLKDIEKISIGYKNKWTFYKESIEEETVISEIFKKHKPKIIINLAAQGGVRYSLKNPSSYIQSNLVGFSNILELCRFNNIEHLIYASSSSVYGGNVNLPYSESQPVNHPLSLYAATKKSNELMAHAYSHLYDIPCTGLRFFTVYGPWGRPDMAPIIFAKAILKEEPLNIFNYGNMRRDFTFIDDIVDGIVGCLEKPATKNHNFDPLNPDQSSSFAPYRIFNIGNNNSTDLMNFIEILEDNLGKKAIKILRPLEPGDVENTAAKIDLINQWVNFKPKTSIESGVEKFAKWFLNYYQ